MSVSTSTLPTPVPTQPTSSQRPAFHFTPNSGWINDPNGMIYFDGEYHLFYQHHPASTVWGPMHWGHAISRDLMTWQELPIALAPDAIGMIFSGSTVIDRDNTAGFGANALVAIFTHDTRTQGQTQSLAFSSDKGRTWSKYAGNPCCRHPPAKKISATPKCSGLHPASIG
jgi:fructan beta-fructosidase